MACSLLPQALYDSFSSLLEFNVPDAWSYHTQQFDLLPIVTKNREDLYYETRKTDPLVQSTPPKVVGDYDIRHGIENKLDILSVCGASHVAVNLFCCALVLSLELSLDIGGCLPILLCS